ncbi:hemolysin family protein [Halalkalicoccus sp. NIPERK01]|uniref:hemolysin family protein n=1 Tax=Halalkalicoccus sp. NIPERK01 TaxID=3053469 RepID=UPI00256EAE9D|nr:hemolysin family protein [Halalkalicoccus sp. NIPERK01]MDL5362510.1 hemolysin family protein [Halalkalicoccus sp. NIPERK01]
MVDVLFSVGGLLLALFLVVLNGFFVASEFAFVRIRSTAVDRLVGEGRAGAETLAEAVDSLDDYLAVTQLGITISSLGLGWVGEPAVAALIEPVLESVLPPGVISLVAFAIGFGFITFLHVVFGELAPKTIAIQKAERISLLVAPPMKLFYYLFVPGIVVFNGTANFFTRLIGVSPASETEETLSEEEILLVLTRSGKQGAVDMEEVEMIERVFDLDDTAVRQVMIPRPDVVWIPADCPLSELRSIIVEAGHTRYPVLEGENDDEVVGFVDVKDVLRAIEDGEEPTARDLAREVIIIPETGRIDDLLAGFQRDRSQMAAVIDEWGAFEGIVTIEDIVEEIVGDIQDQFDVEVEEREPSIEHLGDGAYAIDGGVSLSNVNDALDAEFERAEYETIGGLVLDRLGRVPEVGDEVSVEGYRLSVEVVDGTRISTVVVRKEKAEEGEPETSE